MPTADDLLMTDQPKNIIYQAASALESNNWQEYFQLNKKWQACRSVRTMMIRMIRQDPILPSENMPQKETISFPPALWDANKTRCFFETAFKMYHRYMSATTITNDDIFRQPIKKDDLKYHGFFSVDQSQKLYQHAQEIQQATEHSNHLFTTTTKLKKTYNLSLLQGKLLKCIDAYSGFFSISPSRRRQRNEVEAYIRNYLNQTDFQEQPYIHLMNYLANQLEQAQILDQAKSHQHSFHKKGYSRLSNMLKTMHDQVIVSGLEETKYDTIAFQEQFKAFVNSSNTVTKAVLNTLQQTLSHWQPIKGQERLNQAVQACKNACDKTLLNALITLDDKTLLNALITLDKELETNTSANLGKLDNCVLQALYYYQIICEPGTTKGFKSS